MYLKRFCIGLLTLSMLFAAGCGSKPAPAEKAPAPAPAPAQEAPASTPAPPSGEIEFFFGESPGLKPGFAAVIEAYKAKNPNVTVKVRTVPFAQYANQLKVMWASNNVADVVLPGSPEVRNLYLNGAVQSVESILPKEKYGEFIDAAITSIVQDGKPYGYPWRESAQAMYYNKGYFELAGIKPATLEQPWTWDQWLTNVQKVTAAAEAKKGGKVWGVVYLSNPPGAAGDYWYNPIIRTAGARDSKTFAAIAPDGGSVSGYLNTPEAIKAFQFFQDLFVKHKLAPQAEVQDAFGNGKATTMISFIQTGTTLSKNFKDLKWGVMPLPYHVTPISHTGGMTFVIPKKAKNPAAAMDFVKFASSEEGLQAFFKADGPFITARKSVLNDKTHFPEEYQQVFLQVLQKWGVARPSTGSYPIYDAGLSKLFRDVALGANVPETVNATAQEIDAQLKEFK